MKPSYSIVFNLACSSALLGVAWGAVRRWDGATAVAGATAAAGVSSGGSPGTLLGGPLGDQKLSQVDSGDLMNSCKQITNSYMCCICLGRLRTGFGLPKRRYKFRLKSEKHEKTLACKVNPAGRISEKVIKSEYNSDDKLKKQKEKVKVDKLVSQGGVWAEPA